MTQIMSYCHEPPWYGTCQSVQGACVQINETVYIVNQGYGQLVESQYSGSETCEDISLFRNSSAD